MKLGRRLFSTTLACLVVAAIEYRARFRGLLGGLLWPLLTFAGTAVGIGFVMSRLQGIPFNEHVIYVGQGLWIWNLIAASVSENNEVLRRSQKFIIESQRSEVFWVVKSFFESLIQFFLQGVSLILISVILGGMIYIKMDIFIDVAIVIILSLLMKLFSSFSVFLVAEFAEVYRAAARLAFFLTPVIWVASPNAYRFNSADRHLDGLSGLVAFNPVAHALNVVRSTSLEVSSYLVLGVCLLFGILLSALLRGAVKTRMGFQ